MVLIFILGLLLGIFFKTQALRTITIGFDDRKVVGGKHQYDLQNMINKERAKEKEILKKQEEQMKKLEESQKNVNSENR